MRNLFAAFAAASLALTPAACEKTPEGGTPGTADSFTINLPATAAVTSTTVKKGETREIELTVKANKDFKGKVSLKTEHPDKIKTELKPSSVELTAGQESKVHLLVTNSDAPAGDATIRVTGTPDHGSAVVREVKIKAE